MPHGVTDEQIRHLSRFWALYGHESELYRFLKGEYSPRDLDFAVDALNMHLDTPFEFVDDQVRRSIYRSLIDAIPIAGPSSVSTIVRMVPRDRGLQLHLMDVLGNQPHNEGLSLECLAGAFAAFVQTVENNLRFEPVIDADDGSNTDPEEAAQEAFRTLFRYVAKATKPLR